jgi:hypothetical protein
MDPDAALMMWADATLRSERMEYAINLVDWMARGGFPPRRSRLYWKFRTWVRRNVPDLGPLPAGR